MVLTADRPPEGKGRDNDGDSIKKIKEEEPN